MNGKDNSVRVNLRQPTPLDDVVPVVDESDAKFPNSPSYNDDENDRQTSLGDDGDDDENGNDPNGYGDGFGGHDDNQRMVEVALNEEDPYHQRGFPDPPAAGLAKAFSPSHGCCWCLTRLCTAWNKLGLTLRTLLMVFSLISTFFWKIKRTTCMFVSIEGHYWSISWNRVERLCERLRCRPIRP